MSQCTCGCLPWPSQTFTFSKKHLLLNVFEKSMIILLKCTRPSKASSVCNVILISFLEYITHKHKDCFCSAIRHNYSNGQKDLSRFLFRVLSQHWCRHYNIHTYIILNEQVNFLTNAITSHTLSELLYAVFAAMLKQQQQRYHVHWEETHLRKHSSDFPLFTAHFYPERTVWCFPLFKPCNCKLIYLKFFPIWERL